jgi:CubicO group peptidase (beta-lactamase class C family)
MTTDTRLNLGSIGKIFTRTAVAQLAEAGKLSLDDKLSRYLPDFPHADSITIDMLARHRSGVGDFFNDAYQAMDKSKLRHNRDYLALIRDQGAVVRAGHERALLERAATRCWARSSPRRPARTTTTTSRDTSSPLRG